MIDLSKCTLAELEAEIERRKAEPDYAAWEPKWQAFREVMSISDTALSKHKYISALIAAHNTPLAGEDEGWMVWERSMTVPEGVSLDTHEVQYQARSGGSWRAIYSKPNWTAAHYRYRPKQTDDWIPWTGGKCPVPGDTRVCVRIGTGEVLGAYKASGWDWDVPRPGPSIIAYRVVKEP